MLEYEVKNGGSKTEVSITMEKADTIDELGYRMLKENSVDGILEFSRSIENEHTVYDYDVTGRISVQSLYEGQKIGLSEVRELFSKILMILLRAEEYFLDKDSFIIGQEFIYIDRQNRGYGLMYCPQRKVKVKEQLADLTEYIINQIKYGEQAGVRFTYDLFGLFRDGHSTLSEILLYVQQGRKQQMPPVQPQNPVMQEYEDRNGQQPNVPNPQIGPVMHQEPRVQCTSEQKPVKQEKSFSAKKLLLCCGAVIAGIAVMGACYVSGVLFISHTNKLDMTKTAAVGLIISAVTGYLCYLIYGNSSEEAEKQPKKPKAKKENKKKKKENSQSQSQQSMLMGNPPKLRATVLSQETPMGQQAPINQPVKVEQPVQVNQPVQISQPTPAFQVNQQKKQYRLVGECQQYSLYKMPYLIGKSAGQVDGVIYSDAVSKVHAEFIEEGEQLYIVDMSSTNGTYVNQRKLASNQRVQLHIGDQIQIADKQFALVS